MSSLRTFAGFHTPVEGFSVRDLSIGGRKSEIYGVRTFNTVYENGKYYAVAVTGFLQDQKRLIDGAVVAIIPSMDALGEHGDIEIHLSHVYDWKLNVELAADYKQGMVFTYKGRIRNRKKDENYIVSTIEGIPELMHQFN